MAVAERAPSYHRIPSSGQLTAHGAAAAGAAHGCRGRAARAARSSLPILLACLLSSTVTYLVIHGLQSRAAAAGHMGPSLDDLAGGGSRLQQRLPGGGGGGARGPTPRARLETRASVQLAAAARLLERQHSGAAARLRGGQGTAAPAAAAVAAAGSAAPAQQQHQKQQPSVQAAGPAVATAVPGDGHAPAQSASHPGQAADPHAQQHHHIQQAQRQQPPGQQQQQQQHHHHHHHQAAQQAPPKQQPALQGQRPGQQQQQQQQQQHQQQAQQERASPRAASRTRDPSDPALPALASPRVRPGPRAAPPHLHGQRKSGLPALPPFGRSGKITVALVNHAPYHLEIVAGWLHVLGQMDAEVIWYQSGQRAGDGNFTAEELLEITGFQDLLSSVSADFRMVPTESPPVRVDFAVFVSPEYYEAETKAFLERALPISSVMIVHNGENRALQRLEALAPRVHIVTLAPHVAAAARRALAVDAEWAMATLPFMPKSPCSIASVNAIGCLHGFAIQGNFEPQRRNYTRVWDMLRSRAARGELPTKPPLPPLHLHLVGRGRVGQLALPDAVRNLTTVHFNEPYPDYYETIHHAHALLLVLASDVYVTKKMSSSVVTSLMTGVPVVADEAVLKAYTFLTRDSVFLMSPGEDEADAMLKILRKSPAEIYAAHRRVSEVAADLNRRTMRLLTTKWMPLQSEVRSRHAALKLPYAEPAAGAEGTAVVRRLASAAAGRAGAGAGALGGGPLGWRHRMVL